MSTGGENRPKVDYLALSAVVHETARRACEAGINVLPSVESGLKAPSPESPDKPSPWEPYQTRRTTLREIDHWFLYGQRIGLGFVCGAISGNLECLDFDDAEIFERFVEAAAAMGLGELFGRIRAGYCSKTPSGGHHVLWRCETIGGNPKLAMRPVPVEGKPNQQKTLIELKAEGGYVIEPPSGGTVHPSGLDYVQESGAIESIVTITPDERELVLSLARSFDERANPELPDDAPRPKAAPKPSRNGGNRPGDDLNERGDWSEVLAGAFSPVHCSGRKTFWRRVGKSEGHSATTGFGDADLLYVFSSSTELEVGKWYTKYTAYARLHHGNDWTAAAKALAERGYGEKTARRARRSEGGGQGGEPGAEAETADGDRPEIEITVERHEVVEQAVQALTADPDLYSRGGTLVSVVTEQDEVVRLAGGVEMANAKGTPRVIVQPESVVGCRLTSHAKFYAWSKDKNGEWQAKDCHPPGWLIKAVTEQGHWPGIRPLVSIAGAPYIRADGSIVQAPGYDAATGTLYRPSIDFPTIPVKVSQQAARDAAKRLRAIVDQFPFASEDDAAVWLAGLLTAVARPAIRGPVPGIAVIGNRAGCGKGLLIDVVGIAVWGMNVPAFCYPYDAAEANKVKVAIALESIPAVHFDNLEEGSTYGNPALDSAITSTIVQDRILGTSKTTGRLALRPCWWLSGNNNVPAKDAYRRWLPCNISTPLERPEEREDIKVRDLRAHVAAKRGEIIRDALVILRAHAEASYPGTGKPPLGSFEEWDRIVRGAVWFATGNDACATRRKAADESPERLDKIALLEGWRELPTGKMEQGGHTVEEARQLVEADPKQYATLHAVFIRKARGGKFPDARSIGKLISGMQGATFDGMSFAKAGTKKRSALWAVAGASPSSPDNHPGGEFGEFGASNSDRPKNGAERENIYSRIPQRSGGDGGSTRQTHQTHPGFDVSDPDDENLR
jgi:hypothetical protein